VRGVPVLSQPSTGENQLEQSFDSGRVYNEAGAEVGGVSVDFSDVPNMSSIRATYDEGEYRILPSIREVPVDEFSEPESVFYSKADFERARDLSEAIGESGELNPLIVVIDDEGPYILEGAHRYVAVRYLGKSSFPALVVDATTNSGNTLYQSTDGVTEHEREVRDAVSRGKIVPAEVLYDYAHRDWARAELERREREKQRQEHLSGLRAVARTYERPDSFREYIRNTYPDIAEESEGDMAFFDRLWKKAQAESKDRAAMNATWVENTKEKSAVREYLRLMRSNADRISDRNIPAFLWGAAQQDELTDAAYEGVLQIFRRNPTKYRRLEAVMMDDTETLRIMSEEDKAEAVRERAEEETDRLDRIDPRDRHYTIANEVESLETRAQVLSPSATQKQLTERIERLDDEVANLKAKLREQGEVAKERSAGTQEALASARKESEMAVREERERWRDAITSAREEARAMAAEVKRKEREKRALKRKRDLMRDMARKITKAPPKSVDVEFRKIIEAIAGGIDPNFRSAQTREMWRRRREFFEKPENKPLLEAMPQWFQKRLYKRDLNEFTYEELAQTWEYVKYLTKRGRAVREAKDDEWRQDAERAAQEVTESALSGEELSEEKVNDKRGLAKEVFLKTMRPERIADAIDNFQNFSGPVWQQFIKRVRDARREEFRKIYEREDRVNAKLKELGLKTGDLSSHRFTRNNGEAMSLDEMIDVYAKRKNASSYLTIKFGNRMSDAEQEAIIAELTDNEKAFGDFIIQEYADNYQRLRNTYIEVENKDLGQEKNYTPMRILEIEHDSFQNEIAEEMSRREWLRKASMQYGFFTDRQNIPEQYRRPTQLGTYAMWKRAMQDQEHYINLANEAKRMRYILNHSGFRQAVKQRRGGEYIDELEEYVNRTINPSQYKARSSFDRLAKMFRSNAALAYLAGNLGTVAKQIPSAVFFLTHTRGHFLTALGEMVSNWHETRQWVIEQAPQLKERSLMRSMEELKLDTTVGANRTAIIRDAVSRYGMGPIRWMDMLVVTAGFRGTYLAELERTGDAARARDVATSSVARTQEEAAPSEIPSLYANQGMLSLFIQFTNQLNNIWNMVVHDGRGALKNGMYMQGMATYLAVGLNAVAIWSISTRSMPDEGDDWVDLTLEQLMSMIPVAGSMMGTAFNYFSNDVSVEVAPQNLGALVRDVRDMAVMGVDDSMSEGEWETFMEKAAEAISVSTGLPYVLGERLYQSGKALSEEEYAKAVLEPLIGGTTIPQEQD